MLDRSDVNFLTIGLIIALIMQYFLAKMSLEFLKVFLVITTHGDTWLPTVQWTIYPIVWTVFAVNGGWSDWGSWSSCSEKTTKTRIRQCNNPAPSNGGATCAGLSAEKAFCPGIHIPLSTFVHTC